MSNIFNFSNFMNSFDVRWEKTQAEVIVESLVNLSRTSQSKISAYLNYELTPCLSADNVNNFSKLYVDFNSSGILHFANNSTFFPKNALRLFLENHSKLCSYTFSFDPAANSIWQLQNSSNLNEMTDSLFAPSSRLAENFLNSFYDSLNNLNSLRSSLESINFNFGTSNLLPFEFNKLPFDTYKQSLTDSYHETQWLDSTNFSNKVLRGDSLEFFSLQVMMRIGGASYMDFADAVTRRDPVWGEVDNFFADSMFFWSQGPERETDYDVFWRNNPNYKLYYPEPYIASPSFAHEDIWFIHILHFQYWLWFFFISIIMFYFITFINVVRWCNVRTRPKRETRGASRSKCADLITASVPLMWAIAILITESFDTADYNDGFGNHEVIIGIRGFQWGWKYYYPKSDYLNMGHKNPTFSEVVGNSLKYSTTSSVTSNTSKFWKYYQSTQKTPTNTLSSNSLLAPNSGDSAINFFSLKDIGSSTRTAASAYKRTQRYSRAQPQYIHNSFEDFTNRYHKINSLHLSNASVLAGTSQSLETPLNYNSLKGAFNHSKTLLESKALDSYMRYSQGQSFTNTDRSLKTLGALTNKYTSNFDKPNKPLKSLSNTFASTDNSNHSGLLQSKIGKLSFIFNNKQVSSLMDAKLQRDIANFNLYTFDRKRNFKKKTINNILNIVNSSDTYKINNIQSNNSLNSLFSQDRIDIHKTVHEKNLKVNGLGRIKIGILQSPKSLDSNVIYQPTLLKSKNLNTKKLKNLSNFDFTNADILSSEAKTINALSSLANKFNITSTSPAVSNYNFNSSRRIADYNYGEWKQLGDLPSLLDKSSNLIMLRSRAMSKSIVWSNFTLPFVRIPNNFDYQMPKSYAYFYDNLINNPTNLNNFESILTQQSWFYKNLNLNPLFNVYNSVRRNSPNTLLNQSILSVHVINWFSNMISYNLPHKFDLPLNNKVIYNIPQKFIPSTALNIMFSNTPSLDSIEDFFSLHKREVLTSPSNLNPISVYVKDNLRNGSYIFNRPKFVNFSANFQQSFASFLKGFCTFNDEVSFNPRTIRRHIVTSRPLLKLDEPQTATRLNVRKSLESLRNDQVESIFSNINQVNRERNFLLDSFYGLNQENQARIIIPDSVNGAYQEVLYRSLYSQSNVNHSLYSNYSKSLLHFRNPTLGSGLLEGSEFNRLLSSSRFFTKPNSLPSINVLSPLKSFMSEKNIILENLEAKFLSASNEYEAFKATLNNSQNSTLNLVGTQSYSSAPLTNRNFSHWYVGATVDPTRTLEGADNSTPSRVSKLTTSYIDVLNYNQTRIESIAAKRNIKASIKTLSAVRNTMKVQLEMGQSLSNLHDISNSAAPYPTLFGDTPNFKASIGKNRYGFLNTNVYKVNLMNNLGSHFGLWNGYNARILEIPFAFGSTTDIVKNTWFDKYELFSELQVSPSSLIRHSLIGLKYPAATFDYDSDNSATFKDNERYFIRRAHARKNHLPGWSTSYFVHNRIAKWSNKPLHEANPLVIGKEALNSPSEEPSSMEDSFNHELTLYLITAQIFEQLTYDMDTKELTEITLPERTNITTTLPFVSSLSDSSVLNYSNIFSNRHIFWQPITKTSNYYYVRSALSDLMFKRENMYRTLLSKSTKNIQLPMNLTSSPNNYTYKLIKSSLPTQLKSFSYNESDRRVFESNYFESILPTHSYEDNKALLKNSFNIPDVDIRSYVNINNPQLNKLEAFLRRKINPVVISGKNTRDYFYSNIDFIRLLIIKDFIINLNKNLLNVPLNTASITNHLVYKFIGESSANSQLNQDFTMRKSQFRPMRKGIINMVKLHGTNAVAMPTEIRLRIIASSKDVIHSWAIPSAGIKIDCIPGYSSHRITIFLVSGIFWGQCMEICGRFHHWMPIIVYFMRRDLFFLWCSHFIHYSKVDQIFKMNERQASERSKVINSSTSIWVKELTQLI